MNSGISDLYLGMISRNTVQNSMSTSGASPYINMLLLMTFLHIVVPRSLAKSYVDFWPTAIYTPSLQKIFARGIISSLIFTLS
jgi:hypothetical protein